MIREEIQKTEELTISQYGVRSKDTLGRRVPEEDDAVRTPFQRDVDRITHCKAFRRLKQKTQVFLEPEGDHYRTRLTHTLEVTRIARTLARAMRLNEDLTEAIGLGHDLGHTPFGHAGERALNEIMAPFGGFRHYEQSLRVVDVIEKEGFGLNLTYEVRDGILRHTCDPLCMTKEGQLVRLADKIAYINHDVDDAIRAGVLSADDIPANVTKTLGYRYSERINTLVEDVISVGAAVERCGYTPAVSAAVDEFTEFLYANVYRNPVVKGEERKVKGMIEGLFEFYMKNKDKMGDEFLVIAEKEGLERAVTDYVAGMTDSYAIEMFNNIFVPMAWTVK